MKADEKLEELGIEYEEVVQDQPTKSCDDAARERGMETRQIVKSLIIESEGEKYHVLLPGDRTLSEKKFGAEYRMVPPEESEEITGFEPGTVHPFSTDLLHVVDERVFENDKVSHTVGEKRRGVILEADNFRQAVEDDSFNFEVRDIAVSTDEDIEEIQKEGVLEEDASFIAESGYRKKFLEISKRYDPENILDLIKAFDRNEIEMEIDVAEEILDRAEGQTHIQRLVKNYSEEGDLPEKEEISTGEIISEVLEKNPEAVEDYRSGKGSALNYLMGQVMEKSKGKANPGEVKQKLEEELE